MRLLVFAVMFALLTVTQTCAAADIWIEHWNSEGIDIYAIDKTIRGDVSQDGNRYFTVSTKFVKGGKLQQTVKWKFSSYRGDMWRYETSTMDGSHTTVVIPRNRLFEFCMNKLGWTYTITNDSGIKYYQ